PPRMHDLATGLLHLAQCERRSLDKVPGLFVELPERRGEQLLAFARFALGDGPGAVILLRPEGPAEVHQQDFGTVRPLAKEEQSRGGPGHQLPFLSRTAVTFLPTRMSGRIATPPTRLSPCTSNHQRNETRLLDQSPAQRLLSARKAKSMSPIQS